LNHLNIRLKKYNLFIKILCSIHNKLFILKQAQNPGMVEKRITTSDGWTDGIDGIDGIGGTDGTDVR